MKIIIQASEQDLDLWLEMAKGFPALKQGLQKVLRLRLNPERNELRALVGPLIGGLGKADAEVTLEIVAGRLKVAVPVVHVKLPLGGSAKAPSQAWEPLVNDSFANLALHAPATWKMLAASHENALYLGFEGAEIIQVLVGPESLDLEVIEHEP